MKSRGQRNLHLRPNLNRRPPRLHLSPSQHLRPSLSRPKSLLQCLQRQLLHLLLLPLLRLSLLPLQWLLKRPHRRPQQRLRAPFRMQRSQLDLRFDDLLEKSESI